MEELRDTGLDGIQRGEAAAGRGWGWGWLGGGLLGQLRLGAGISGHSDNAGTTHLETLSYPLSH